MTNYIPARGKRDKKGKGLGVMSNAELKQRLQKEGLIKPNEDSLRK